MNTMQLGFKRIGQDFNRHLPGILTGVAVVGVFVEAVVMYKKAPKIKEKIAHAKEEYEKVKDGDFAEKAAVVGQSAADLAPDVLPPVIVMGGTIACIVISHKESMKRLAMVTGTLALTQDKLTKKINELEEYKNAAKEETSSAKYQMIEEKANSAAFNNLDANDPVIFDDANLDNDCIFMEENSGLVWRDNYLRVMNCVNKAYELVHHEGQDLRLDEFIGILNEDRYGGNRIRNPKTNNIWVYYASRYNEYKCHNIEDFMDIQSAGFTAQGIKTFIIRSNPVVSNDIFAGQPLDDATCGDGVWR